jgi:carbon monoxide dehydrogenase subunit G
MVWPTTNQANNFDNSFFQGFIDVSGGHIINRNGGIYAIDGSGIFQDLLVNTINEKIINTGVTIDSVLLKDNNVTAHTISAQNYSVGNVNFISASRQGNFRDLEVKDSNNIATILLTGDGGGINIDGTLSADTINEQTSGTGVTIESVLLKDNNVTAHTISAQNYSVGNVNFISATRQGNFRDLEVKDTNNNATILLTGDGGNMDLSGNITMNGPIYQF